MTKAAARSAGARAAAVAAFAIAVLAGCSLIPEPAPTAAPAPIAGDCLAARSGTIIDRASVVPCTDEHLFDVTGVVTWDGMDDAIAASDATSVFTAISKGGEPDFDAAMFDACDELNRQVLGIDAVSANGVDAASTDLAAMGPLTDFSIADRDSFVAGDHTTVCVVRWTDFTGDERTISYPEGIGFADYADPEFPSYLHVCAISVDTRNTFLDCADAHESQQVLSFAGIDVVGADWIATVDPTDLSVPDYSVPDAVCVDLVAQAFPGLPDGGWATWSNIFTGSSGWRDFDGTVDPESGYYFSCDLNAPDEGSEILGDAFSGTATIVGQ